MTAEQDKLEQIVANAHQQATQREKGYREQAIKMYPWICGRCQREFTRENISELSVHHRDHNHDNNPEDGSNWELLCIYCHDNEHSRYLDNAGQADTKTATQPATHNPFAGLQDLLKNKD